MGTYTIEGHPLNMNDLATTPGGAIDPNLAAAMRNNGVGSIVTFTLGTADLALAEGMDALA
jgi:hypothetical protein